MLAHDMFAQFGNVCDSWHNRRFPLGIHVESNLAFLKVHMRITLQCCRVPRSNRGADSQSAAPRLPVCGSVPDISALGGLAKKRVETSLDPAGKSACATGSPICLAVMVWCLSAVAALAQTSGSITGEVTDQSGAVAPNAAVTATNSKTNVARSTTTNAAGIYSFPDLTPGTYEVKVTAAGFANISNSKCSRRREWTSCSRWGKRSKRSK